MHPIPPMVMPGDRRQGIWSNGICQIMITRACNLSCFHCSSGSNLRGKPMLMTPDQFEAALISLDSYFGIIAVFGGNPAVHPKFDVICEIMRGRVPFERRGLWCNSLLGKGAHARVTFNPARSNLNVHMDRDAYEEFARDWPESKPFLKGLDQDSLHGSPWVAIKDVVADESRMWDLIGNCDINKHWSSLIGVFRGELRAWFCEIAAHQAMLNETNPDWDGSGEPLKDTGLPVVRDWWKRPQADFEHQIRTHCVNCGIPLRREGQKAIGGSQEEFSATHRAIARPRARDRPVAFVETIGTMARPDRPATNYLPNTTPGYKG